MPKILVVGSINMDLVVRVPHIPLPGETVLGSDFETYPGGKGANQAVSASRMGGEVTFVGRVGNDSFGDKLINTLVEDKISTTNVIKDSTSPTGVALISVSADGENSIVVASGANFKVSTEDVEKARPLMRETDILLVQLECPLETVIAAVDLARTYDVPVLFNPAPAQTLPKSLFAKIEFLTPNTNELSVLTGETDINKGIKALQSWGVKNIVVTLGANGARVISDGIDKHIPAFEVTAVDTTAAGDALNGAMAVSLAEGKSLLKATQIGMAAGALAATKRGAQSSLPTRQTLIDFLRSHGIEY